MGAGFGHTFSTGHPHEESSFPALAFMLDGIRLEDLSEFDCDELYSCLSSIESVEINLKGRIFQVDVRAESTYYGDDYCIIPKESIWERYCGAVEDELSTSSFYSGARIDWEGVTDAISASQLEVLFKQALLKEVLRTSPFLVTRERVCGWSGTSYVPLADKLMDYQSHFLARDPLRRALNLNILKT